MPCNSDYMEPNTMERSLSNAMCIHNELDGVTFQESWRKGYHPDIYNKSISKSAADTIVSTLCSRLKDHPDTSSLTLEAQIWWRDHQKADKIREDEEEYQLYLKLHAKWGTDQ